MSETHEISRATIGMKERKNCCKFLRFQRETKRGGEGRVLIYTYIWMGGEIKKFYVNSHIYRY